MAFQRKRISARLSPFVAIALLIGCGLALSACPEPPKDSPESLRVSFIDVGQADCIAIQCGERAVLIDAGTNGGADELVATLRALGISKFDAVIGTHPHEDHIGGLDKVIASFEVASVYLPKKTANTETYEDLVSAILAKGLSASVPVPDAKISIGGAELVFLGPANEDFDETNDYSLVTRLTYGETSFLFAGDTEAKVEGELIASGYELRSDVLKVAHHGSSSSSAKEFLGLVKPAYAVIMVGKDNSFGHPNKETLANLSELGTTIYRTDLNGTITFISDGKSLSVETAK